MTGHNKFAKSPKGYYSLEFYKVVHHATKTDRKYRYRYALQFLEYYSHWLPNTLRLVYARSYSHTTGTIEIDYVQLGQIIIGKMVISLWSIANKLKLEYAYYAKMDLRRYKAHNFLKHDYKSYSSNEGEYTYGVEKELNRQRFKHKKTK